MRKVKKLLRTFGILLGSLYLLALAALYFGQEFFLFHPERLEQDHVFSFEGDYEELWFDSAEGGRVNALLFKASPSKGVVLHLHGNGGSIQRTGNYHGIFNEQGYDLLTIDYRTFGKSTGKRSKEGFLEDAEAAYAYLLTHYPEEKIHLYGQSLGTGIATPLAAAHNPRSLSLEAPYTAIADVAQGNFPIFPVRPLLKFRFETFESISRVQCPVLVFHGTKDAVIPYQHGEKVAAAAPNGRLVTLHGEGHRELILHPQLQSELFKHLAQ